MKNSFTITIVVLLVMLFHDVSAQDKLADSLLIESVNSFVNDWHYDASVADIEYFDKIADDGIYIGTDASELWTKNEFYNWGKKYFDKGKAWNFTTINRSVYLQDDSNYAWFDELLETGMGKCRASGVLRKLDDCWEIVHYHLSIAIPNESVSDIKQIIEGVNQ